MRNNNEILRDFLFIDDHWLYKYPQLIDLVVSLLHARTCFAKFL